MRRRLTVPALLAAVLGGALGAPAQDANWPPAAERRALAVATYTGGEVNVGELEDAIAASSPLTQAHALEPAALRDLLDRSLRFELLAAEAERRGYGENMHVRDAVKHNAVRIMIERDINVRITVPSVTRQALADHYRAHPELAPRELRRAGMIVLASEAEARALLPQLRSSELREFRELARHASIDEPSRMQAGDLRFFDAQGRGEEPGVSVDPVLARAAFALSSSADTSDVIPLGARFAILKLMAVRPPANETPEQIQERQRLKVVREQREAAVTAIAERRRKLEPPVVHPELIGLIRLVNAPGSAARTP